MVHKSFHGLCWCKVSKFDVLCPAEARQQLKEESRVLDPYRVCIDRVAHVERLEDEAQVIVVHTRRSNDDIRRVVRACGLRVV